MTAIYVTSDQHFDHRNANRLCERPFSSLEEMNEVLLSRWNETVGPQDIVYHLGDLALGQKPWLWLEKLHGQIIIIRGNHDRKWYARDKSLTLSYAGIDLLLIHRPWEAADWEGWILHGHSHQKRPFIDPENRRVNVSVEMTDYRPVLLDTIVERIYDIEEELLRQKGFMI